MAENEDVSDELSAETLIGAVVHFQAVSVGHVQRTGVAGAQ